jgi:hypothetical protein
MTAWKEEFRACMPEEGWGTWRQYAEHDREMALEDPSWPVPERVRRRPLQARRRPEQGQ